MRAGSISTRQWCGSVQCASVCLPFMKGGKGILGDLFLFSFLPNYFHVRWINIHCVADMIRTQLLTGKQQEPVQQTSILLFVSGGSLTKTKSGTKARVKQQNRVSRRDKAYNLEQLWNPLKKIMAWISFLTIGSQCSSWRTWSTWAQPHLHCVLNPYSLLTI